MFENIPRSFNRAQWKFLYRQYRIVRREALKASMDMMIYGSGIVEIGEHVPDGIRHIKRKELRCWRKKRDENFAPTK